MVPCHEIFSQKISWNKIWEYREACDLRRKGWINKDGSLSEDIRTKYDYLNNGVSDQINECLDPDRRQVKQRESLANKTFYYLQSGWFEMFPSHRSILLYFFQTLETHGLCTVWYEKIYVTQ